MFLRSSHLLLFLIQLSLVGTLEAEIHIAAGKEQNSITIAVIGLYSELVYNNPSDYSQFNPFYAPGWQIYDDLSIQHATQLLNANSSILQNTSIKLKHFNFYDPDYAYDIYATSSLGYAGLVALNITQNPENSDIVAVIGGWSGDPVKIEAEIYSYYNIPYCGIIPPDSIFDNKYNYKSFFRTTWSRYGYELHVLKFLQTHNVTRIGIVTYGSPLSQRLQDTLTANGIDIPAFAIAPGYEDVSSAITMLKTKMCVTFMSIWDPPSPQHIYTSPPSTRA
ncbi:hypothetical protein BCR33DRAFT_733198 [Rhizoclosmatium globosum]|uniref:Receptor ligand binding region domain-containing protein n=1 Tax=Rhizoclosmatium globosum TaxID=329046 RepID=A0A1Y2CZN2_9FUNG|nr:hypothetical protein BCR33DRAFT_733198 [Rhizoclosmatium globosum]|eukprot:ORY52498.1 hypothetical protein BCR33DRAFT_733198 [Rhizoclosmatium globosum]